MGYVQDLPELTGSDAGGRVQIEIPDLTSPTGWRSYWYLPTGGSGGDQEVFTFETAANFPNPGASETIYIALDSYKDYIWDDGAFHEIVSGMTEDGTNSLVDYLNFNVLPPTFSGAAVQLGWDIANETLAFGHPDGGIIQINQEEFDIYTNLSGVQLVNGDIVAVTSATGNRTAVTLADATSQTISESTIGMVTVATINNNNSGRITKRGKIRGLNTNAYNEGDMLYVDPLNPGKWTASRPSFPNMTIAIGVVTVKSATIGVVDLNVNVIDNNVVTLNTAQSVTEIKTFTDAKLAIKGTGTNKTILATAETGDGAGHTATFPAKTGTVAMTSDLTYAGYDATIGTGGQYATIAAAQAALTKDLKLIAVGDIADAGATTTIGYRVIVDLNGKTLTSGSYGYVVTSGKYFELYNGNILLNGSVVGYFQSTNFDLNLHDLNITCSQTANNAYVCINGHVNRVKLTFTTAYYGCGLSSNGYGFSGFAKDIQIVVNNANSYACLMAGQGADIRNVIVSGTSPSNVNGIIWSYSTSTNYGCIDNITGTVSFTIMAYFGVLRNIKQSSGQITVKIGNAAGIDFVIENSYIQTFSKGASSRGVIKLNNVHLVGGYDATSADYNLAFYTDVNCYFGGAMVFEDNCKLAGYFASTLTINGNNNVLKSGSEIIGAMTVTGNYNKILNSIHTAIFTLGLNSSYNKIDGNTFPISYADNSGNSLNTWVNNTP